MHMYVCSSLKTDLSDAQQTQNTGWSGEEGNGSEGKGFFTLSVKLISLKEIRNKYDYISYCSLSSKNIDVFYYCFIVFIL